MGITKQKVFKNFLFLLAILIPYVILGLWIYRESLIPLNFEMINTTSLIFYRICPIICVFFGCLGRLFKINQWIMGIAISFLNPGLLFFQNYLFDSLPSREEIIDYVFFAIFYLLFFTASYVITNQIIQMKQKKDRLKEAAHPSIEIEDDESDLL